MSNSLAPQETTLTTFHLLLIPFLNPPKVFLSLVGRPLVASHDRRVIIISRQLLSCRQYICRVPAKSHVSFQFPSQKNQTIIIPCSCPVLYSANPLVSGDNDHDTLMVVASWIGSGNKYYLHYYYYYYCSTDLVSRPIECDPVPSIHPVPIHLFVYLLLCMGVTLTNTEVSKCEMCAGTALGLKLIPADIPEHKAATPTRGGPASTIQQYK